ncbi:MAG TPA: hypothetical protein VMU18_13450 [Rhodoblastus sp.]|nr:hypothetical protein [Rhodoblastus sp.]
MKTAPVRASTLILALTAGALSCAPAPAAVECASRAAGPLKPAALERFEREPAALLRRFPHGGYAMAEATAQLAARGPRAIAQILSLAARARGAQQQALGQGLSHFVSLCAAHEPEIVGAANASVVSAGRPALSRAFFLNANSTATIHSVRPKPPIPRGSLIGQRLDRPAELPGQNLRDPFGSPELWR